MHLYKAYIFSAVFIETLLCITRRNKLKTVFEPEYLPRELISHSI